MPDHVSGTFIALQSALIGRYSLERELGRGGMGIVYLAQDVALDRPVALKLLPPVLAAEPKLRQRFLREARTAAKLSHPNIVPIFPSTRRAILSSSSWCSSAVRRLASGCGTAVHFLRLTPPACCGRWRGRLAYAHAQGVVHRDVKPDNILLESGSGRALVADFGIAHQDAGTNVSGSHEVLGTAEYISPEQAAGEAVDGRSDIYSLGVVAYYAVSGKLPFEGRTVQALLAQHITQPAPRAASVASGLPRRIGDAIDRCLKKAPGERFANGEQLAESLASAAESRKELPAPLRLFIKKMRRFGGGVSAIGTFWVILTPYTVGAIAFSPLVAAPMVALWTLIGAGTFLAFINPIRTLLKTGFTRDDAVVAWKTEAEREREERAIEWGVDPSLFERVCRGLSRGALAFALLATLGQALPGNVEADLLRTMIGAALTTWFGAGVIALSRKNQRTDIIGRWFGKLWDNRVGRWLFKVAGIGLKAVNRPGASTYRPTELAIGMGIDNLFLALPKAERQHLGDLPGVVRGLEADAMRMRHRVEDLTAALDHTPPENRKTAEELRVARESAQGRQAEAVTALEGIRLNLLRLTAGMGSVDSLTQDLASAREVSEGVERLLAGRKEVDAIQVSDRPLQIAD